jgi:hypothetical protein
MLGGIYGSLCALGTDVVRATAPESLASLKHFLIETGWSLFAKPGMGKTLLRDAQVYQCRHATLSRDARGGKRLPALLATKFFGFHAG